MICLFSSYESSLTLILIVHNLLHQFGQILIHIIYIIGAESLLHLLVLDDFLPIIPITPAGLVLLNLLAQPMHYLRYYHIICHLDPSFCEYKW